MDLATVASALVIASVAISLFVTVVAILERPHPMAVPVILLTGGAAVWALPIGILMHSGIYEHHLWLQRVRYIGTVVVPLAFFVVATRYAGYTRILTRSRLTALAIIPGITTVLVWTSDWQMLFWASIQPELVRGVWTTGFSYGPWFWVHLGWIYVLVVVGLVLLAREAIDAHRHQRNTVLIVAFGGALPFLLSMAHFGGIGLAGELDPTPIAVGLGGAIVGVGLLVFDLVELRPIARDRLIERLQDGVIVIDTDGQIRDSNPVARDILQHMDGSTASSIDEILGSDEVSAIIEDDERRYRIDRHELVDATGQNAGQMIYLHDVTELARREQRISVLHRVLRHNIRNEMTVLQGHLEYVQREAPETALEDVQVVERSAERIMGFAENAQLIELTLRSETETQSVSVQAVVEQAINRVTRENADIDLTIDESLNGTTVQSINETLLTRAIGELIENAVIHGSGPVEVGVHARNGGVNVSVHDRGSGIPPSEIEALEAPVETSLDHGSGLGLWVARWTADLSGGELRFETHEEGSIVTMELPSVNS